VFGHFTLSAITQQQLFVDGTKMGGIFESSYTLCSENNTHSHFLSYLHELFVDLNKNCSEYTQGLTDSDNVKN